MPEIRLVENMKKAPGRCLCCNTTPNDIEGRPKQAIDLNVDVDWGNNAYLCDECVNVICDLVGRVTVDEHEQLKQDFSQLNRDHQRLRKHYSRKSDELKQLAIADEIRKRARKEKSRV